MGDLRPLAFTLAGTPVMIPGYMVWAAVIYSLVGTLIAHRIGRPLVALNFEQQRFEADFRFSLVRLRENAEGVALYAGKETKRRGLSGRFGRILDNWWRLIHAQKRLTWFTVGYRQAANVFPILVAAPRYFSGAIQLGGLMQIASAFGRVQDALNWFVDSYSRLAEWKASVDRLVTFEDSLAAAVKSCATGGRDPNRVWRDGRDRARRREHRAPHRTASGRRRARRPAAWREGAPQRPVRERQEYDLQDGCRHLALRQRHGAPSRRDQGALPTAEALRADRAASATLSRIRRVARRSPTRPSPTRCTHVASGRSSAASTKSSTGRSASRPASNSA